MIHFLDHDSIDKKKWDACIGSSSNGMIYAYSWYLDIVSPDWNALVKDDYEIVFPITWRKKYSFQYLYQPFFTQQLGIFSAAAALSEKTVQEFLDALPAQYKLVEIQLNTKNTFQLKIFRTKEKLTHHLDLSAPYEKIHGGYSDNLKRNIRRSEKEHVEISPGIQPEEVINIFRSNKGKEISLLKNKDYKMLLDIIHEAEKRNLVTLLGAKSENRKWCAGAVFLKSNHEYIFLFSGTNNEARESGAMSLLIDSFIKLHAQEKSVLDFEGSMDKNLARYYKSFGSKEIVYLQIIKNKLPGYINWLKRS